MALTKARPPVTAISEMLNGTTNVDIPTAGSAIDVNVTGVDVADISSTQFGIDDAIEFIARTLTGESISLATTSGAEATLETNASNATLQTTSLHNLILGANSLSNLILGTDGRVTLATEGNQNNHLVSKLYVDDIAGDLPSITDDIDATLASEGHLSFPTNAGNIIINWGTVNGDNDSLIAVTFDEAFPNAGLAAVATRVSAATSLDRTVNVSSLSTTGMDIRNNSGTPTDVYWIAIGF